MYEHVASPAVNPGFGGQKFIEYQVEKVRKLRQMCDDAGVNPWIEVDGGISGKNAYKVSCVAHAMTLCRAQMCPHPPQRRQAFVSAHLMNHVSHAIVIRTAVLHAAQYLAASALLASMLSNTWAMQACLTCSCARVC